MDNIDFDDYPIIIMSCDSYQDIWEPMSSSIDKFWPDCPFPIYLCSEKIDFTHPKIKNIKVGRRMRWAEMLDAVLTILKTKNVIYLQEDYILKGEVENHKVLDLVSFFDSSNAAYLRLIPYPRPDRIVNRDLGIGIIEKGSSYRTSLQAAIWDREILLNLLETTENGWEFERNSVSRSSIFDRPFYSVEINSDHPNKNLHKYPLDYYSTAILQGKWQKEGVKMLKKAGISINTKGRGVLTRWDFYYYHQRKKGISKKLKLLSWLDRNIFNRNKNSKRHY